MRVLEINAIFHDPAAALIIDGRIGAAAEEERFNRRKHGKRPVPFSAWEQPAQSAAWCLEQAGLRAGQIDRVGFSYDPALVRPAGEMGPHDPWDRLRTMYAEQAPSFLADALPGLDPAKAEFVPHHVAHAASAVLGREGSVLVCDGRGERASHLAGRHSADGLDVLAAQELPHSLGLMYEDLAEPTQEHADLAASVRPRPDVWVKGGDYTIEELPEASVVADWGGRTVVLPYLPGRSTTRILARRT